MTVVAGVDFGTLSVRVTLVDSRSGPIGTGFRLLSRFIAAATTRTSPRNLTPIR